MQPLPAHCRIIRSLHLTNVMNDFWLWGHNVQNRQSSCAHGKQTETKEIELMYYAVRGHGYSGGKPWISTPSALDSLALHFPHIFLPNLVRDA